MTSTHQASSRIALFGIALLWMITETPQALAHDSWINRGGYRNPAGEWCCGDNDCQSTDQIAVTGKGWIVGGTEFVPFEEVTPSPDGKIWICRRPITRAVAYSRRHPARDMARRHDEDRPQQPHASITGSTSGIGFAITRGLVQAGAAVIINGRPEKNVDAATQRLVVAEGEALSSGKTDKGSPARRPGTAR